MSAASSKNAADYYIHKLPGAPAEPRLDMYSGHIQVDAEHHGNLFFWLVKNRHIANRQRTVLWFNGGPGCSSMDGALMEVGPYRVQKDGKLQLQDGSWDEFANVVFIDQPVGTGFSYADTNSYPHEMDTVAATMVDFLTKFYEIFPELEHDDIYLSGESYAGQWIPYVADAMVKRNAQNPTHHWNVSGLLIGNGWISGQDQYTSYIPFAYETGVLTAGSNAANVAERQQQKCLESLSPNNDHVDNPTCEAIMQEILRGTQRSGKEDACVNMYDVRLRDSYPSCGMNWPPDLEYVKPYLRRDDVKAALHVNADKKTGWVECNNQVSSAFTARNSKPSVHLLPGLLAEMPIVLFSGDKDLICNHIGTENLINRLEFNGGKGMEISTGMTAPKRDWTFEGEPAGQYQTARNLTYLRFYNSSHMVPFDYPRRSRDMLDRFMGVDIASIGGTPQDSRIDGEKGIETSVGGHPNSTAAKEKDAEAVQAAAWAAYRRSGEVALVFVIIAAVAWGIVIVRQRSRRRGYKGVLGADPYEDGRGLGLDGANGKVERDVEAARDFDEAELDDLEPESGKRREAGGVEHEPFGLEDDEDEDEERPRVNGHARG